MDKIKKQIKKITQAPGVYIFRDNKHQILYIGKAVNLRNRVRSYFVGTGHALFLQQITQIQIKKTDSEIEALILEAQLIKKYRPKYNVQWKDDKNYFYLGITREDWPRLFLTHQIKPLISTVITSTASQSHNNSQYIGPFVDGQALKMTLRVLRKIFPYRTCRRLPKRPCLQYHLQRCPAPCRDRSRSVPALNRKDYQINLKNLIKILKGKQKSVVKKLRQDMQKVSQKKDFERAAKIRDQIQGLKKVLAHAHIIEVLPRRNETPPRSYKNSVWLRRIEAYDISNISGGSAVGSMIVFEKGQPKKQDYRRFKIKTVKGANDTAMLQEVLCRRLKHPEWPMSDVVLIDGGRAQLNTALKIFKQHSKVAKNLPEIFALAKKQEMLYTIKNTQPIALAKFNQELSFFIQRIRDKAHCFALTYHHKLRKKDLFKTY